LPGQGRHDLRYEIADEFMEVVYKLWEGSWEDGAVLRDRQEGVFADPGRVHSIHHEGRYYRLEGYHLSEPSPQRTPVLFQAGSSPRGRAFAARHAECVFIGCQSKPEVRRMVAEIRSLAEAGGRDPASIIVFHGAVCVPGRTRSEAEDKLADYRGYGSVEGGLVLQSGWQGKDFSRAPLTAEINQARKASTEAHDRSDRAPDRRTIGELGTATTMGGGAPLLLGTASEIADEMQSWVEEAGIDGFNLASIVAPESYVDFVEIVVPELQRRGVYKSEYAAGTLREKFGGGAFLAASHPGARYRVGGRWGGRLDLS